MLFLLPSLPNPCSDMASAISLQLEEDLSHSHQVIHPESKPQAVFINSQLDSTHTCEHTPSPSAPLTSLHPWPGFTFLPGWFYLFPDNPLLHGCNVEGFCLQQEESCLSCFKPGSWEQATAFSMYVGNVSTLLSTLIITCYLPMLCKTT